MASKDSYLRSSIDHCAKQTTARQVPTIASIQELLMPHMLLGGKEQLFRDSLRVTTPRCLFFEASAAASADSESRNPGGRLLGCRSKQPLFISGPHQGLSSSEIRDALSHDHRCRSATTLFELATKLYGMLERVNVDSEQRLADMKKELTLARKHATEWQHHFGSRGVTPLQVEMELCSLRQQVGDLQREKAELEAKVKHHAHHVDCLYGLMPASIGPAPKS
jgi:hypothetical protein